jgi:hypothetical protein
LNKDLIDIFAMAIPGFVRPKRLYHASAKVLKFL